MSKSGKNDPDNRTHDYDPQKLRNSADFRDSPIEQEDGKNHDCYCQEGCAGNHPSQLQGAEEREVQAPLTSSVLRFQARQQVSGVLGKAQSAGCNGEGRAEGKLPDKEKRYQLAEALGAIDFAQVYVGSAGAGH